jgi:hypothetical protein
MEKHIFYTVSIILLLIFLPSSALAKDLVITLEYFHTSDPELVDRVNIVELVNKKQREKIYDDLINADESSRRTLSALADIFEWYRISNFQRVLTRESRVLLESFIVPADSITSQSVIISGRQLDIYFNVQSQKNLHVPLGLNIIYDGKELYSDIPRVYPMDKLILLRDLDDSADFTQEVEILILKITRHEEEESDSLQTP